MKRQLQTFLQQFNYDFHSFQYGMEVFTWLDGSSIICFSLVSGLWSIMLSGKLKCVQTFCILVFPLWSLSGLAVSLSRSLISNFRSFSLSLFRCNSIRKIPERFKVRRNIHSSNTLYGFSCHCSKTLDTFAPILSFALSFTDCFNKVLMPACY